MQDISERKNIPVPFTSHLTERIQPGQSLLFQGTVNPDATHFEFSLICGEPGSGREQIALQVCFRFDVGITVLNSFLDGDWGEEEFHSNPFFHGKAFDVRIRVHADNFELFANQLHWAHIAHRIDFRQIDYIQASGDISLSMVNWAGHYYSIPYEMNFHGHGLESGQRLFVCGIPRGDFTISLIGANKDALFQLGTRFSKQQVTRNAQTKGDWGVEEHELEHPFPFKRDEGFDLVVLNEPVSLQLVVNGQPLCAFFHRTDDPHKDYKLLRVDGQLELTGVEVSLCWESVGGVAATCCKVPQQSIKQRQEQMPQMGKSH